MEARLLTICAACPTGADPREETKTLSSGFPVCDLCFAKYQPQIDETNAMIQTKKETRK